MIDIEELIPLIDSGWVTMNKLGGWTWWATKPVLDKDGNWGTQAKHISKLNKYPQCLTSCMFKIKQVDDYRKSLRKCGR